MTSASTTPPTSAKGVNAVSTNGVISISTGAMLYATKRVKDMVQPRRSLE